MKRTLLLWLGAVMIGALILSGCGPAPTPEPTPIPKPAVPTEAPAAEEFTLGLSLSTLDNPFFVTLKEGAEEAAAKAGVKLIVVDCEDDSAKEAANLEDLIAKQVDALLINPTDAEAVVPSIGKANEAGIPVFTIDRAAAGGEIVSHIASDNVAGGKMAGEKLAELLGGEGKVVELEGITGTSSARERGQGFNEVMDGYADIEVVARQTAEYDRAKGLSVFENILEAQPEIDGVFAHNDEMILGAIEAAEAAGRAGEIVFVGFDAIDDAVAAVKEGKLAATIAQQPAEMGRLGVEFAAKYLGGETVEEYIPVPLALVEAEAKPAVAEEFTLGLSLSTLDNPFFVTLKEGAEEAAAKAGVKLIVVDCEDDSAKEAANLEDLIAKQVDALLINPTDAEAVVPSIGKANEAGIPVFTIDRAAAGGEIVSHIASDNVAGGKMAGEKLAELLGGEGKVVELEGITGTSSARERGQGFNEVMDGYADIEVVARQTAEYDRAKGLSVFENILEAQPEIDGVFAHNDEMILGAIEAAEAAGRAGEIVFVGFDAIDDAVAAVKEGKLAATIAQQPAEMGRLGVEFAAKYLGGETVEAYIPVDLALVTPETVE
jgi:ribose transport system substrate-binding protein